MARRDGKVVIGKSALGHPIYGYRNGLPKARKQTPKVLELKPGMNKLQATCHSCFRAITIGVEQIDAPPMVVTGGGTKVLQGNVLHALDNACLIYRGYESQDSSASGSRWNNKLNIRHHYVACSHCGAKNQLSKFKLC